MTRMRQKEGLSKPFVLLLLAIVTVVVTLTIGYWMGGVTSIFTKHEQVDITGAEASRLEDGGWVITLQVKNTGSVDATLDLLLINGKAPSEFGPGAVVATPSLPISLQAGSEVRTVTISVKTGTAGFITGATIDVEFRSSAGRHYIKPVMLI